MADDKAGRFLEQGDVTIIGLKGVARSGKDFLTKNVLVPLGFLPINLGDHFKIDTIVKGLRVDNPRPVQGIPHGAPYAMVDVPIEQAWETDKSPLVRQGWQQEGTERGRWSDHGQDIWVDVLEAWWYRFKLYGFDRFAVADIRFQNEIDRIHDLGGVVFEVTGRGGLSGEAAGHVSESGQDALTGIDFQLDNSPENEKNVFMEFLDILWDIIPEIRDDIDDTFDVNGGRIDA